MIPAKANLLENQLRQKVIQFEHSLARISDTRKHLRDHADLVKSEIRAAFGTQLTQIRRREQQLLERLDTVASVKDGILSEQQDQLHQALGACTQGLEWYQTAVEDMKESRMTSIDSVESHINEVLKKLSVVDIKPRETAVLGFEADSLALRKAIASFGHVRAVKTSTAKSFESLPAQLEDYEEEDVVHSLLHKAVNRQQGKNATTIFVGRPALSNDPKDWLLREALTGHHSAPMTPEHVPDHNQSAVYMKHCSTTSSLMTPTAVNNTEGNKSNENGLRQAQVHSWLHHIKNQVENEPNIFEDFDIVKDREVKNALVVDSIKAALSEDVAALFRPYFEAVLMSPASQWLFKSIEKMDFGTRETITGGKASAAMRSDPLVQDFMIEGDAEDMESCPSTVTYESSEFCDPCHGNEDGLNQDTYAKLWNQFVTSLWNSTDSLWILPCSSQEKPQPLAMSTGEHHPSTTTTTMTNHREWLAPSTGQGHQQFVVDVIDNLLLKSLGKVSMNDETTRAIKPDKDQWLLKSPMIPPPTNEDHGNGGPLLGNRAYSTSTTWKSMVDAKVIEEWLGWKALLERVRNMGDESWLHRYSAAETTSTMMME